MPHRSFESGLQSMSPPDKPKVAAETFAGTLGFADLEKQMAENPAYLEIAREIIGVLETEAAKAIVTEWRSGTRDLKDTLHALHELVKSGKVESR